MFGIVHSRIGELKFFDGVPTDEPIKTIPNTLYPLAEGKVLWRQWRDLIQ